MLPHQSCIEIQVMESLLNIFFFLSLRRYFSRASGKAYNDLSFIYLGSYYYFFLSVQTIPLHTHTPCFGFGKMKSSSYSIKGKVEGSCLRLILFFLTFDKGCWHIISFGKGDPLTIFKSKMTLNIYRENTELFS